MKAQIFRKIASWVLLCMFVCFSNCQLISQVSGRDTGLMAWYWVVNNLDTIDDNLALEIVKQLNPSYPSFANNEFTLHEAKQSLRKELNWGIARIRFQKYSQFSYYDFDMEGSIGNYDFQTSKYPLIPFFQNAVLDPRTQNSLVLNTGSKMLMKFQCKGINGSSFGIRLVNIADFSNWSVPVETGKTILQLVGEDRKVYFRIFYSLLDTKNQAGLLALGHKLEIYADRNRTQLLAVLLIDESSIPEALRPAARTASRLPIVKFEDQSWLYGQWHRYLDFVNLTYHSQTDTIWIYPDGKLFYHSISWGTDNYGRVGRTITDTYECKDFTFEIKENVRDDNGKLKIDTLYRIHGDNCTRKFLTSDGYIPQPGAKTLDGPYFIPKAHNLGHEGRTEIGYDSGYRLIASKKLPVSNFRTVVQVLTSGTSAEYIVSGNTVNVANSPEVKPTSNVPKTVPSSIPTTIELSGYPLLLSIANQFNNPAKTLLGVKFGYKNCLNCSLSDQQLIANTMIGRLEEFYRTQKVSHQGNATDEFSGFSELEIAVNKIEYTMIEAKVTCQLELNCTVRNKSKDMSQKTIRSQISLLENSYTSSQAALQAEISLLEKAVEKFLVDCFPIFIKIDGVSETSRTGKIKKIVAGDSGDFPNSSGNVLNTLATGVNENLLFAIVSLDDITSTTDKFAALSKEVGECRFEKIQDGKPSFIVTKGDDLSTLLSSGKAMLLSK